MEINGKEYPLWNQFIERKKEIIGKKMMSIDMGTLMETIIEDVALKENGNNSAMFIVYGKDFDCGFDVHHGGITESYYKGGIGFTTRYGGSFSIDMEGEEKKDL
jgi:hypothetical protein